jgi:hypothetical protein
MSYIIILYLLVLGGSGVFFIRGLFRYIRAKEFFWNMLPDSEKECINGFPNGLPKHPISNYYKEHALPWTKGTVDELLKRNEILSKCDKEKAKQLFHSEKQMFYSWNVAVIATGIFAFLCVMMK